MMYWKAPPPSKRPALERWCNRTTNEILLSSGKEKVISGEK
jgi:hypothetical protein